MPRFLAEIVPINCSNVNKGQWYVSDLQKNHRFELKHSESLYLVLVWVEFAQVFRHLSTKSQKPGCGCV